MSLYHKKGKEIAVLVNYVPKRDFRITCKREKHKKEEYERDRFYLPQSEFYKEKTFLGYPFLHKGLLLASTFM